MKKIILFVAMTLLFSVFVSAEPNLALNKSVSIYYPTADSWWSGYQSLTDGGVTSGTCGGGASFSPFTKPPTVGGHFSGANPPTFVIDLNDTYSLSNLTFYNSDDGSNNYFDNYSINISTDNVTYTTVVTGQEIGGGATNVNTTVDADARYVMVQLESIYNHNNDDIYACLFEIEVRGTAIQGNASPPTIQTYNCTSCNGGDNESPFTTQDTTPTFSITTDKNANCAIGTLNQNYTAMIAGNLERNCTSGGGSTSLTCTLPVSDGIIINETDNVYIGCQAISDGLENTSSTSGSMQMDITTAQTGVIGGEAIEAGINASAIFAGATVYTNQQVYMRDINNGQTLATYDRVATWSLKVWAFNFIKSTETAIAGLFNITPSVYTGEYDTTQTFDKINDSVRGLINSTYS